MKFIDLLTMSTGSLKRRRLRTFLTVLGVVIGCCSIVIMISLGIGLQEKNREMIEATGSLTTLQVTESFGNDGGKEPKRLTDETVKEFLKMEHVKSVYPMIELSVMMRQGIYEASYVTLKGVPKGYLEKIPLKKSKVTQDQGRKMRLIYGNEVIKNFTNRKTKKGFYETNELPDIDLMKEPMFVTFDVDGYYEAKANKEVKMPKKYLLYSAGVVDGEKSKNYQYSYTVFAELEELKSQLKKAFKKKAVPGQPTRKKGKPYPYLVYNTIEVNVDEVKHVKKVQDLLSASGYQVSGNIEWLEQAEKQAGMIQAVLGGIGAVSLLVAAIGIANTMMMSIYERTKEIGILKVLGCDLGAIRNMFLLESGFIGFLGGAAGIVLSYAASFALNHFLKLEETGIAGSGNISRIPIWLSLSALAFSVLIGMLAGFFPALRAMRMSPLAAIRND